MKYISTRGNTDPLEFSDVLLMGLAPDGGLMLPESYPQIDTDTLDRWQHLSYPDLALEVMSLYVSDIPHKDLKSIIDRTYTKQTYQTDDITPIRQIEDSLYIQGLSNGPTLAFKDIAMQFLGNAFEYVLTTQDEKLNIIGATSGDTGSAAEYALRGKKRINVFMLSPQGRMSAFQKAQMYSLTDYNIHNLAIKGTFDDCQDIIKDIQSDDAFKYRYSIGTVNSINWGRVLAQIVYYFYGYLKVRQQTDQPISFCVPSGNFGNVCAGHIARQMGLPIHRLIVATNENDVLHEFFNSGNYRPRTSEATYITSSPSMDISKASNFERFVFDLLQRDSDTLSTLWQSVSAGEGFDLSELKSQFSDTYGFASGTNTHQGRLDIITQEYEAGRGLIDPHTADGIKVAREVIQANETIICLETALPVKFAETIYEAVGEVNIPRPESLVGLESLPQQVTELDNETELVKEYIREYLDV